LARILIVEDNVANMKLASLLLRKAGHDVLCASDAETGLMQAKAERPDLIVMDIQLPGMDGLAATTLLKKDMATATIPVIALTAMASKSDQEKCELAGCDAYIAKPIRYLEFYSAIDSLLANGETHFTRQENSRPEEGARSLAEPEAGFALPSREEAQRRGQLILVAEDHPTSQKLILRQLAMLGFAADIAANGRLALDLWQSGDYALLLSDLHMPEMDGYELAAAIRSQEHGARRMPIVGLTASFAPGDHIRRQVNGIDDYLSKPLQLAELKAVLEKWLPAAKANTQVHGEAPLPAAVAARLDVRVLANLIGNDPELIAEFLNDFRISAQLIAMKLRTACTSHQAVQASEEAHKLTASARAVGAMALGKLCAEMESAGKSGNTQTLTNLLPLFEQELDGVNAFLERWQSQHSSRSNK
jgi:CheY-like chemotaxis protein/HPt (histidine-containing phosphotransfer) domain-containing protein